MSVQWASEERELQEALGLRERVFCAEQGVPLELEHDGRDAEARHLVALEPGGERVIATLRLLCDGDLAKIGRVAVERSWRRRGIASRMLAVAIGGARARGCSRARLAAQLTATELYARAGFRVDSKPFEEAGISHVWMALVLDGTQTVS